MTKLVEDKSVVITGGSTGIGRATAKRFAEEGANVIVANRNEEKGQAVVDEIGSAGTAVYVETDVSEESDVQNMISECISEYGGLDILINNAAIEGPVTDIASYPESELDSVLDVNLKGVWYGTKHGVDAMKDTGGGAIVNVSSIGGKSAVQNYSGYNMTKAAINQLTRNTALEYVTEGIRANSITPGIVQTEMIERVIAENPETEDQFEAMEPMPGLAQPEEIANSILFLGSEMSSRVTGHNLSSEGGYLIQ